MTPTFSIGTLMMVTKQKSPVGGQAVKQLIRDQTSKVLH